MTKATKKGKKEYFVLSFFVFEMQQKQQKKKVGKRARCSHFGILNKKLKNTTKNIKKKQQRTTKENRRRAKRKKNCKTMGKQ